MATPAFRERLPPTFGRRVNPSPEDTAQASFRAQPFSRPEMRSKPASRLARPVANESRT